MKYKLVLLSIALAVTCTACSSNEKIKSDKNKTGVKVEESVISFANMKIDNPDLKLSDNEIEVLKYFDEDYFEIKDYDNLQRYPKVYENAQIAFPCKIVKTISSKDNTYELLVSMLSNGAMVSDEENLLVISGKQQEPRLIEGDIIQVYGRYKGIEQYNVDGTSLSKPHVTVNSTAKYWIATSSVDLRYNFDTINTVAKAIFGNDIKVKEEVADTDYALGANYSPQEKYYLVTPDNQANANFKDFEMTARKAMIRQPNPTDDTQKEIHIAADFEHYIVSTYESKTKMLYLEYYDRDFKKIWSNEYSNVDSVPYDYTSKNIYLVADNDLHILDTKTGKNVQDPVMVGEKVKVIMEKDGAILIGTGNKDNVMKVDTKGKTLWKSSVDIEVTDCSMIQIVNNNIVVSLESYERDESEFKTIISGVRKIVAIGKDGKVLQEFIDWEYNN